MSTLPGQLTRRQFLPCPRERRSSARFEKRPTLSGCRSPQGSAASRRSRCGVRPSIGGHCGRYWDRRRAPAAARARRCLPPARRSAAASLLMATGSSRRVRCSSCRASVPGLLALRLTASTNCSQVCASACPGNCETAAAANATRQPANDIGVFDARDQRSVILARILPHRRARVAHFASGSGRSWKCAASGLLPLPPSISHGVRSPLAAQIPRPFQPAFGSSMRPSKPFA